MKRAESNGREFGVARIFNLPAQGFSVCPRRHIPAAGEPNRALPNGIRRYGRLEICVTQALAFTLIELLIVIAIIAILAALIMPITGAVNRQKIRSLTKAELTQIESAIENYKSKHSFYPPDNPGDPNFLNQLYYELSGTTLKNGVYTTLDGNATITAASLPGAFGPAATMTGFVNSMQGTGGDEGIIAQNFLKGLKPSQIGDLKFAKILVGSVGWPATGPQIIPRPPAVKPGLNPWRYVLTGATNNPTRFDLWIDVMVGSKTNRICNWSDQPIVL